MSITRRVFPALLLFAAVSTLITVPSSGLFFGSSSQDSTIRVHECEIDGDASTGRCIETTRTSKSFHSSKCNIVYVHLFKTAGTSFGHFLAKWGSVVHRMRAVQYTEWFNINYWKWKKLSGDEYRDAWNSGHRDLSRTYDIVWGHMMNTKQEFFDCSASLTILRDPVRVIVSAALFEYRQNNKIAKVPNLDEQKEILWRYIKESPRFVRGSDGSPYYVGGLQQIAGRKLAPGGNVSHLVSDALENLQYYALVGVSEELTLVEKSFIRMFDGSNCDNDDRPVCKIFTRSSKRQNQSPQYMSPTRVLNSLTSEEIQYLETMAGPERMMYEKAKEMWEKLRCELLDDCSSG